MLIGPNATIILDRKVRSTYMANVYDFYKPILSSEYPIVDGPLSNRCYLEALDQCFNLYFNKLTRIEATKSHQLNGNVQFSDQNRSNQNILDLKLFDAIIFHAPYCKLVQKSLARLYLLDNLRLQSIDPSLFDPKLEKHRLILNSSDSKKIH